ncbi:ribosomal protein L1p/L10e [Helicosporidium sp. ATCC 50920]|nr:ribosomal protein L1p/L10e [Helicosporidium sp. ATCC 50920]|eukprot:KDD75440.1 ribosomal protein L1p/L10e [Helicosporidium sp. ATCC 50920]
MATPGLSRDQVLKASTSLLKYVGKRKEKSTNLLEDDELLFLTVALKKVPHAPRKDMPHSIPIPHPLYTGEEIDICLIVADRKEGHKASKEKVRAEVPGVAKVVGMSKLGSKYESYEAKRKLCNSYDLFFADDRIITKLPKLLGKTFFKKKKQPVPVRLSKSDWAGEISKARKCTYFFWTGGPTLSIRVGRSSQTAEEIADNALKVIQYCTQKVPKKWDGIKALFLKTGKSVALPVYQAAPDLPTKIAA